MKWYAGTIFLSSFLLFQIQPIIGKCILPWFGGTPAVWTTCLLFFQLMLLVGYGYAHATVRYLGVSGQVFVHSALLGTTVFLMPILPSASWQAESWTDPTWRILSLLIVSIGGPYFVLSATAPLMQAWFRRTYRGTSPYRLYAVSNLASLFALFTYPTLFERLLPLPRQSTFWSTGYVVFALMCGGCAWRMLRATRQEGFTELDNSPETAVDSGAAPRPRLLDLSLWLGLAASGAVMLMATTNQMCQEVAAVPFLWILPLAVYLVTFIICFDKESWYKRSLFSWTLVSGVLVVCLTFWKWNQFSFTAQIAALTYALFVCCMSCHGELVRSKPHARYLTLFYLLIAAGGALGGIFVTIVAPVVFDRFHEYETGLVATCLLVLIAMRRESWQNVSRPRVSQLRAFGLVLVVLLIGFALRWLASSYRASGNRIIVVNHRDFYGTLRVKHIYTPDPERSRMTISHGTTVHGSQFLAKEKRHQATLYYAPQSGIGIAVHRHPRRSDGLRIGVIGLGAGTIAAYARATDWIRFYEINPTVVQLAQEHFTFQQDAISRGAEVDVLIGDARITLERQLAQGAPQHFDILVVDAFSSDSIPVHLITKECFETYWRHLKPRGILAVHISNRHLDLSPVIRNLADVFEKDALLIRFKPEGSGGQASSDWILVTSNEAFLADESVSDAMTPWSGQPTKVIWTDSFSSPFSMLR